MLLCHFAEQKRILDNRIPHNILDPPRRATRRATRRRFWVRPGRTSSWCNNFLNGDVVDDKWKENLCMSRASLVALSKELRPYIEGQTTAKRAPIETAKRVELTLYYLSDEGWLRKTASVFSVSWWAVSVVKAIAIHLCQKYIKMPFTEAEDLVLGFHHAHGMSQCLGAVDGTHIEIKQPSTNSMDYINRKGNSLYLNIQAVCDYKFRFMDVVITWPGSVHKFLLIQSSTHTLIDHSSEKADCG